VSPRGEQFLRGDAECVVDPGRRLVSIKFGKTVTFADIERYAKQLRLNPLFQPEYSEIVDTRRKLKNLTFRHMNS
jgi:hypothetical protein